MPRYSELILPRFMEMLREKFRVEKPDSTNVLHLFKIPAGPSEVVTDLRNILESMVGPGDFGLYVHESEVEWWGVSNSVLQRLQDSYREKWALVLLDDQPTTGYFFTSNDVLNSLSGWSEDESGTNKKIYRSNMGHHRKFFATEIFWNLLREAGGDWD